MELSRRVGWIGIDVGTHTVKLAQAALEGGAVRLHRAAVIQRSSTWNGDDSLALEQPLASFAEIRAALECGGFKGRSALCSLPMNICQLRGLNVPPGTDQERRTMAAQLLAEDWTGTPVAMEFDFWESQPGAADKTSEAFNVNVLAASRPWISQIWSDCREAGLDCWAIDGVPLATARAVGLAGGLAGGRHALAVDWGYSNSTLCVVGDDRPLYTRRVPSCGFGRILEQIQRKFAVTLDEAQHLADAHGFASDEPDPTTDTQIQQAITDAALESTEELVRQIKRTLQFIDMQRRHLHPDAVWLLGGGASARNIGPFLQNELGLPVHIWRVPSHEAVGDSVLPHRAAIFGGAVAPSALPWRAA